MADELAPLTQASEMRTVSGGQQWLNLAQEDCVAFHFTWHQQPEAVEALVPRIEEGLNPLGARPHWGKVFDEAALAERVDTLYPQHDRMSDLSSRLDPRGALRNDFLDRYLPAL